VSRSYAVFDIDGTLVRWQLYHAITDALAKLGYTNDLKFQAVKEARMDWKRRSHANSYKDYEKQLVEAYEEMLGQLTVERFNQATDLVFNEYKDQVYTFTRDLLKDLQSKGYLLFAISNSQLEIVEKIAKYYGFDDCVGAIYEKRGNRFTGHVTVHLSDKDAALNQLVAKHHAKWQGSMAVGDSMSDASMLRVVERPIAFNPDHKLFEYAQTHNWPVVIERKNMVYKLENHDGKYLLAQASS